MWVFMTSSIIWNSLIVLPYDERLRKQDSVRKLQLMAQKVASAKRVHEDGPNGTKMVEAGRVHEDLRNDHEHVEPKLESGCHHER